MANSARPWLVMLTCQDSLMCLRSAKWWRRCRVRNEHESDLENLCSGARRKAVGTGLFPPRQTRTHKLGRERSRNDCPLPGPEPQLRRRLSRCSRTYRLARACLPFRRSHYFYDLRNPISRCGPCASDFELHLLRDNRCGCYEDWNSVLQRDGRLTQRNFLGSIACRIDLSDLVG